jgi:hypothetical protein
MSHGERGGTRGDARLGARSRAASAATLVGGLGGQEAVAHLHDGVLPVETPEEVPPSSQPER